MFPYCDKRGPSWYLPAWALEAGVKSHQERVIGGYLKHVFLCLYPVNVLDTRQAEYIIHAICTVKLVYKHHPREQQNVVLIHRWSLYAGSIAWKIYTWDL